MPINGPEFFLKSPKSLHRADEIAQVIHEQITQDKVFEYFKRLQDPAPSGTEIYTRTPTLLSMMDEMGVPSSLINPNFRNTKALSVNMGDLPKGVVINFQTDDISYLPREKDGNRVRLQPNHAHRQQEGTFRGGVLRYLIDEDRYKLVSHGDITVRENKKQGWYEPDKYQSSEMDFDHVTDRVVYLPSVHYNPQTGILRGKTDNQAGMAAGLVALEAAFAVQQEFNDPNMIQAGLTFTGEEEGPPGQHDSFARQARRVANSLIWTEMPDLVINVDGHDVPELPSEAVWGNYVSDCVGPVTPPHLAGKFRSFLKELEGKGVNSANTYDLGGRLSRSDDVGWMGRVDTIALGHPGKDFHFVKDVPSTNLKAVVNLSKALAWIYLSAKPARA